MTTEHNPLPPWPPRDPAAHKGHFGRVLVVGGSPGFTGAPALAANAAQRGGAGLVTVAVPERCWPIVAGLCVEPMVRPLAGNSDGHFAPAAASEILALAQDADVVCLGPGLGRHPDTAEWVRRVTGECPAALVIDADGLNALAGDLSPLAGREPGSTVLTPHPGEMARLAGASTREVQGDRAGVAWSFAKAHGVVLALKGHRTVVSDGAEPWVNTTGNPGMATGGTGDVLAGLIAALLGQGFQAGAATRLGVFLHGRAGDLAAAETGDVSLVAGDLIGALPRAIAEYRMAGGVAGPLDEAGWGGGEIR